MKAGQYVFEELKNFEGNVGFYFKDLNDGEILDINGSRKFSAASVIKIPLALTAAEQATKNEYSMQDKVVIKDTNRVGGTGVIQSLNKDYVPTVAELILLALSVSDNIATNELIDLVGGFENVTGYCKRMGLTVTSLERKMLDLKAREAGRDNWIAAAEIGVLLEVIAGKVYGEAEDKEVFMPVFSGMVKQQCRNKIPARIPAADYYGLADGYLPGKGEVLVANKTGDLWTTQNDAAICVLPDGVKYILVICTDELKHGVEGIELIAKLSMKVYNYMVEKYK